VLVAFIPLHAQQVDPAKPETNNRYPQSNYAQAGNQNRRQSPIVISQTLQGPNQTNPTSNQKSAGQELLHKLKTDPIVWLTLGLLVLAAAQVAVYCSQLETTRIIERAYVDMSPAPGRPIPKVGQSIDVLIKIKNYGKTPAMVVAVALKARIQSSALPEHFPDMHPEEPVRFHIQPGDTVAWSPDYKLSAPLTSQQVSSLKDGTLSLWILGWVEYEDKFKKTRRHLFTRKYRPSEHTLSEDDARKRNWFSVVPKPGFNGDA
jgi:hypothetical protein